MEIWLKRDDLHRTGSFKERGARHALLCLSENERARGVVAASAGNHALGLAFHGTQLGIPVTVVVPETAPEVKINRCRVLGARVVVAGASFDEAQARAMVMARETGAAIVHPFDDVSVIAGQGTIALEMLEQCSAMDVVVVPVGGGGLLAGVATVVKALRPSVRVVAVEPANAAGFAAASHSGRPTMARVTSTIADGLAVARVGEVTFAAAATLVDELVTVTEDEIEAAIGVLACRTGAVAQGAGAAALAAVLAGKVRGRCIAVPLTGRNIDVARHQRIVANYASGEVSRPAQQAA